MQILFYKTNNPYGFMSNYWKCKFTYNGIEWNNTEAPYQAAKCIDQNEYDTIKNSKSANESRLLGQKVKIREDWDTIRDWFMFDVCFAKFSQNEDLLEKLLETGEDELVENSPVDFYWGWGSDRSGKNKLGLILMELRSIFREAKKTNNWKESAELARKQKESQYEKVSI